MRAHLRFFLLVILASPAASTSQTAPAPHPKAPVPSAPQLSPQSAYQEALHPLEVTRHSIANWSDVELAAMTVTIGRAKDACLARQPAAFNGSDLVDLARLCSLGQQWPSVVDAASRYIEAQNVPAKPLLSEAFIAKTEAELRLKQEPVALKTALDMLSAVPYTAEVGDCVDEALGFMRFVYTADALKLAETRQPMLLSMMRTLAPPAQTQTPLGSPSPATPSVSADYAQGLLLPELQQLAGRPMEAKTSVAALDGAIPTALSPDDQLIIAQRRHRYGLLGSPLTEVHPLRSLSMPYDRPPDLPVQGAVTAMLLFPDWCAQCIRMAPNLPMTVFTVEGHSAYVYALLAQTMPPKTPDPKLTNVAFNPAYAASMMQETPTVTVSPGTLQELDADDFPFLLIADSRGILRVLEPVGAQELQPGGEIDSAIALVGKNFAPALPHAAAATGRETAPGR